AVSSAPSGTPSSLNWTPTTPMLSLALAVTLVGPDRVATVSGAVIDTDGALVSHELVETCSVARLEALPAASTASAARSYAWPHEGPVNWYESEVVVVTFVPPR